MSTIVGNLRAVLGLDSSSFQSGLQQSQTNFRSFGRQMATIGAGIATAGAAAFASFNSSATRLTDLQRQADIAGLSAQEFKTAALAVSEYGIAQDKLSDILKDVNDKFGDFAATGGGQLKDFFETIGPQVGVTIEAFEGLNSSEALALYVSSLEKANVSQAEMTFYMEALANDATALVPAFRNGGAEIAAMAERMTALGIAIDDNLIESTRQARGDINLISEALRTNFDQAVLQMGPSLANLAAALVPVAGGIATVIEKVLEWTDVAGKGARKFVDDFIGALTGLPMSASGIIAQLAAATAAAMSTIATSAVGWAGNIVRAIIDGLKGLYQAGVDAVAELGRGMRESVTSLISDAASWGRDIASGLANGISNRASAVRDSVVGLAGNVKGWFTDDLEIQSPSKVFTRYGGWLTDGLAIGIDKGTARPVQAITTTAEMISDAAMSGVDSISAGFADFFARGFKDFGSFAEGILDTFKSLIKQLIATAAKNRIMIGLGMSGVPGMAAGGIPGMGGIPGIGGFGGIGAGIAGFGSSVLSGGISALTGFLGGGGISGAFSAVTTQMSLLGGGLSGLGVALGAVALPLAALGAVFSFFKKSTKELDAGLRITVDGMDTLVETFSKTETRRFWGLSKKRKTSYDDASDEVADPIENYVAEMQAAVLEAAASLGVGASAFEDFAAQISFSTKGLSEEQAIAKIQEEMGKVGDAFAEMIPGLQRFALEGEGALATLNRLTLNLSTVNGALADLGLTLYEASVAGAGAATAFADLFGGLEAFQQASSAYYQAFYTDGERLARLQEISTQAVRDAGLAVPATREAYRQLVEAQNLNTEAGREAAALLLQLAPAFDQLYTAADAARASVLELANAQRQAITDAGDLRRQLVRDSLTDQQRAAQDMARLNRTFADLGLTVPETAAQYRELIRGLDLTTESGRAALESISSVGTILLDTFDAALSAAEAAQQSVTDARASRADLLESLMTEEQRAAQAQAQIMAVFESLNLAVPQTVEGLQALIQGLDLTTEAGRIALARLSEIADDLQEQINSVRQPSAARSREERIDAGRTAYASKVANQTKDLQARIAELTMSEAEKRQQEIKEREALLKTMTPTNRALQETVWNLEGVKNSLNDWDISAYGTAVENELARARQANGLAASAMVPSQSTERDEHVVAQTDYQRGMLSALNKLLRETVEARIDRQTPIRTTN